MTPLRLDADASRLRRQLGPVPWFVLEELLLVSDATLVVEAGARALAAGLSLNKDTAARALGRLRAEGLVVAEAQSNHAGRFGTGRYRIAPVTGVQLLVDERPRSARPTHTRTRPAHRKPRDTAQLSLIEAISGPDTESSHRTAPPPPKQDDALAPGVRPALAGRHRDAGGTSGTAAGSC